MRSVIEHSFAEGQAVLSQFLADPNGISSVEQVTADVVSCLKGGGKILACGNGGSMADAMHFAEEWSGRFRNERKPYPVMALADPTHLTCVSNDYGFDYVFSRMVEAFGRPSDLLFLLSTSGNSRNLIEAAMAAKSREVKVVGLLGRGGGALLTHCDRVIMAPGTTSDRIQEIHMMALHIIIEAAEIELGH